ncbi:MAG: hypothetical protein NXI22_22380 [bacterium]|nr:hypothetical protein [bacterium]
MDTAKHSPADGEPTSADQESDQPSQANDEVTPNPYVAPLTTTATEPPKMVSDSWLVMLKKTAILQSVLMIIVCVAVTLKFAATNFPFKSWQYIALFVLCFGILGVYAIVWQKVLKSFTLIEAYSNKAISGFWFLILGYFLFGDSISIWNFVGVMIITFGVTRLYARAQLPAGS